MAGQSYFMGLSVGSRNQVDMKFLLNKNELSLKKIMGIVGQTHHIEKLYSLSR